MKTSFNTLVKKKNTSGSGTTTEQFWMSTLKFLYSQYIIFFQNAEAGEERGRPDGE